MDDESLSVWGSRKPNPTNPSLISSTYASSLTPLKTNARLSNADLSRTGLDGADPTGTNLARIRFIEANLTNGAGLGGCIHAGPSTIDHLTLARSGPPPSPSSAAAGSPKTTSPTSDPCSINPSSSTPASSATSQKTSPSPTASTPTSKTKCPLLVRPARHGPRPKNPRANL